MMIILKISLIPYDPEGFYRERKAIPAGYIKGKE